MSKWQWYWRYWLRVLIVIVPALALAVITFLAEQIERRGNVAFTRLEKWDGPMAKYWKERRESNR